MVVQDHGSVHTCAEVRQLHPLWESLGLYIFFLPKYCSEMNLIEEEWQRLKEDEIAGRMFDDEYDLAMAVMRKGGLIVTDNILLPENYRPAMLKYIDHVRKNKYVRSVTVPIGYGEEVSLKLN